MNILLMDFNRGTVHKPTKIKEFFEPISDANPFAKLNIRTDVSQLKFKNCNQSINQKQKMYSLPCFYAPRVDRRCCASSAKSLKQGAVLDGWVACTASARSKRSYTSAVQTLANLT